MVPLPLTVYPTPCARRPNSLEKYFNHEFLCLSHLIRCLYLSDSHVPSSTIELDIILIYCRSFMSFGV